MVTTDILATFLMAAAAQQCKRRAAVTKMVRQNGEGPLNLEAQTSQGPLLSARYSVNAVYTNHSFGFSVPLFVRLLWVLGDMAAMRCQQNGVHTFVALYAVSVPACMPRVD